MVDPRRHGHEEERIGDGDPTPVVIHFDESGSLRPSIAPGAGPPVGKDDPTPAAGAALTDQTAAPRDDDPTPAAGTIHAGTATDQAPAISHGGEPTPAAADPLFAGAIGDPAITTGRRGPYSGADWPEHQVGDLLGQGGMAAVYIARRKRDGALVALKVMAPHMASDSTFRRRFELEAEAGMGLDSDHIVRIHAAGEYCGLFYIEMEYVAGRGLDEVIAEQRGEERPFATERVLDIGRQIAAGLVAASERKMVHRDIKPSNVMVTADGVCKIADFGIAKVVGMETLTMTGLAVGTPIYMSPEQGRADSGIDHRADIYSLGIMLYELATLQVPFQGESSDAILYQHHYAEPEAIAEINPDCPFALQAVICKCLQKRPDRRYQSPEDLLTDLRAVVLDRPPVFAVFPGNRLLTGAREALAEETGPNRQLLLGAALIAGVLLSIAFSWWWLASRSGEIGQLRDALAPLGRVAPLPPGAAEQLARLRALLGDQDAEVRAWQVRYDRVRGLEAELAAATDHDTWQAGEAERLAGLVDAYAREVGDEVPVVRQWRARLAALAATQAERRGILAALDGDPLLTRLELARFETVLADYASQLPSEDQDCRRWRVLLANGKLRLAQLTADLARLDEPGPLPIVATERLVEVLADYRDLVRAEDPDLQRWETRLAVLRAEHRTLRDSLQRIDAQDPPPIVLLDELADELRRYAELVPGQDLDLRRWRQRDAQSREQWTAVAARIQTLDPERLIPQDRHAGLASDCERYRALGGDDQHLRQALQLLTTSRERVRLLRGLLETLEGQDLLGTEEQSLLLRTMAELRDLAALDPVEEERFAARAAREQGRIIALREALSVLDRAQPLDRQLLEKLDLYERLVPAEDADARRWRARVTRIRHLQEQLSALDQQRSPPPQATVALDDYETLVGPLASDLLRWRERLQAITELQRQLTVLDLAAPVGTDIEKRLDAFAHLVGTEDADLRRWRRKLSELADLRQAAAGLQQALVLPPEAAELPARLAVLIGAEAEESQALRERVRVLAGPGRPAWASTYAVDAHGPVATWIHGDAAQRFRYVPAGSFRLGSPHDEPGRDSDEEPLMVTLTRSFWLAEHECRQDLWAAATSRRPAFTPGPDHPVERVSWNDIQDLLQRLRRSDPDCPLRLPTEAEWEYACRAGSAGRFGATGQGGAGLERLAIAGVGGGRNGSAPVASLLPNRLGLYDCHGNLWEWCQDAYAPYPVQAQHDPLATSGRLRVVRGGSWGDDDAALRCANRKGLAPSTRSAYVGVRLAIDVDWDPPPRNQP